MNYLSKFMQFQFGSLATFLLFNKQFQFQKSDFLYSDDSLMFVTILYTCQRKVEYLIYRPSVVKRLYNVQLCLLSRLISSFTNFTYNHDNLLPISCYNCHKRVQHKQSDHNRLLNIMWLCLFKLYSNDLYLHYLL